MDIERDKEQFLESLSMCETEEVSERQKETQKETQREIQQKKNSNKRWRKFLEGNLTDRRT